jgi:phage-related protein
LKDGIHELRIKLTGTQTKFLYFVTNVFAKHTDAVPESEIRLAKTYRADFLSRYSEKAIKEEER